MLPAGAGPCSALATGALFADDSDSHSQILCKCPHCPRILLELSTHEDDIGLTLHSGDVSMSESQHLFSNTHFVKDALSGAAVGDGTDGTNKNLVSVSLLHCLGEWSLVCRAALDFLLGVDSSGGDVNQVYTMLGQDACQPHRVFGAPGRLVWQRLLKPVGGRNAIRIR